MTDAKQLLNSEEFRQAVGEMADSIFGFFQSEQQNNFAFIGLHAGGVPLAERLAVAISEKYQFDAETAKLDITMYRDDIGIRKILPVIRETDIPFDIDARDIVLVDDVLSSGRTIRAALDAITDYGRPRRICLAVLVDRGSREFPISADFVGRKLNVSENEKVVVTFTESGRQDAVYSKVRKK